MLIICRAWCNGSYTMMAKPMKVPNIKYIIIILILLANWLTLRAEPLLSLFWLKTEEELEKKNKNKKTKKTTHTQKRARKGHEWAKLRKVKNDCIRLHLKNKKIVPSFFKLMSIIIIKALFRSSEIILLFASE